MLQCGAPPVTLTSRLVGVHAAHARRSWTPGVSKVPPHCNMAQSPTTPARNAFDVLMMASAGRSSSGAGGAKGKGPAKPESKSLLRPTAAPHAPIATALVMQPPLATSARATGIEQRSRATSQEESAGWVAQPPQDTPQIHQQPPESQPAAVDVVQPEEAQIDEVAVIELAERPAKKPRLAYPFQAPTARTFSRQVCKGRVGLLSGRRLHEVVTVGGRR